MALRKQRAAISDLTMHAVDMHADNDLLHEAGVMNCSVIRLQMEAMPAKLRESPKSFGSPSDM